MGSSTYFETASSAYAGTVSRIGSRTYAEANSTSNESDRETFPETLNDTSNETISETGQMELRLHGRMPSLSKR